MIGAPAIVAEGLTVRHEGFTLGPLDVTVRHGERVALVGPNGAGKSTALAAFAGRRPYHDGVARVLGQDPRQAPAALRARVGVVEEDLLGFGWMSVREHLELLASVHPGWDDGHAAELLERTGLPRSTRLANLSRGNRVKLALVGAEAFRPPVLLLDEPTSGIDPVMRSELLGLIVGCLAELGPRALIFSTHLLEDVEAVADRVILLRGGRIILDDSVTRLRRRRPGRALPEILLAELTRG